MIKQAARRIISLQNQLCGMNLAAQLTMLDNHTMEITSLRTGERLDTSSGSFPVTEAVLLRIPGIMELQLAPINADVSSIEQEIRKKAGNGRKFWINSMFPPQMSWKHFPGASRRTARQPNS